MLLLLLLLIPLVTAVFTYFSGKNARYVALGGSLLNLAFVLYLLYVYNTSGQQTITFSMPWIRQLGVSFSLMLDGISLMLTILSSVVMPMVLYASFNRDYPDRHVLYALMMLMDAAMAGSFIAADGFLFYLFWEIALIPIYFICLKWGGEGRQKITLKFFLYTMVGSLFMLFAFIYLYQHTPEKTFALQALYEAGRSLPVQEQGLVFAGIFLAFAIKMPIFPLHTWQPETYYIAPTPGAMLLSGIMLKMATYGIIRWLIPVVPQGVAEYGIWAVGLSVISILYASFISIVQKDYKRLIAFASIAHVGLISAGLLSANVQGIQGGLVEMLSHGINTVGLFFVYDIIVTRTGTADMDKLGGIRAIDPRLGFMFLVIVLSVVALPFTNGFVGEFLLIVGLFRFNAVLGAFAGLSIILGVVYMFRSFQKMMLGEVKDEALNYQKQTRQETALLFLVCIFIVWFGVFPKPILAISEKSVIELLDSLPK
ncbi:MAG: NADH-quinone oxidoreductase subunit M [Bacteroidetes bacterium]|nr:NADH-quinone oxidoreductase subunit M [Bacteroidota bacterium]